MEIPTFIKQDAACKAHTTTDYNAIIRPHGWECIGEYVNRYTPVAHRCLHCGAERERKPHTMHNHIARGQMCGECRARALELHRTAVTTAKLEAKAAKALKRRVSKPITRAQMKTPDGAMSLYVFRDLTTEEIKVGVSRVVVERLKTHRQNSRDGITVLHVVHTTEKTARYIETECVIALHPWRSRSHGREWFKYSDWVLYQIEEIMHGAGVTFDRLMPVSENTPSPAF